MALGPSKHRLVVAVFELAVVELVVVGLDLAVVELAVLELDIAVVELVVLAVVDQVPASVERAVL